MLSTYDVTLCRFQDDESGKKIDLNVSKKMFLQTLNVSSKNDFDLWFANHFEQVQGKLF